MRHARVNPIGRDVDATLASTETDSNVTVGHEILDCTKKFLSLILIFVLECGLAYPNLTARIAPPYYSQYMDRDIPPPNSYPATVLIDIKWNGLKSNLTNDSREFYFSISARCDGLLVNRRTILTAASCVRKYYETYIIVNDLGLVDVKFPVTIDNTHQHWDSLLTAYIGLNRYFYDRVDVSPARPVVIDDIIIVNNKATFLKFLIFYLFCLSVRKARWLQGRFVE